MFRPTENRVLIKQDDAIEKTPGGLVLPEKSKEKPKQGTVIEIGPGLLLNNGTRAPMQISVGEKVIYQSYGVTEIEIKGEKYLVVSENDVLGVITGK